MANYDFKLGEWFKQVEQQEQELKAKKAVRVVRPQQEQAKRIEPERRHVTTEFESVVPVKEAYKSASTTVDTSEIIAESPTVIAEPELPSASAETTVETVERRSEARVEPTPALFGEAEIKPLEDFFSFLDRSRDSASKTNQSELDEIHSQDTTFQGSTGQTQDEGSLSLRSEGTGQPRPLQQEPTPVPEREAVTSEVAVPVAQPEPIPEQAEVRTPRPNPVTPKLESNVASQERWDRVPRHLQVLFADVGTEVAQNSYKTFKESRSELIHRLLDPPITLEEAARILNVCPTTVRRYTNRGVLKHFRTAGNQRRFRLSDVLSFMESQMKGVVGPAENNEGEE